MISVHQPTIFGSKVIAALSSKQNGNMKFGLSDDADVQKNRTNFLKSAGIDPRHTTLVGVTYDTKEFTKYRIVDDSEKGVGALDRKGVVPADALVTHKVNHALLLPLADCVGAILYDERHNVLMVSHLGRHSVQQQGGVKSVEFLVRHYQTNPLQLKVWLSPAVGKATYPLTSFDGKSLHDVVIYQLESAGVPRPSIENGDIDTAKSNDYFSHSEYLKGNDQPGRFAIVAQMKL